MNDIIKKYEGEFGVFELNVTTGEIIKDGLNRDKIWEQAEIKQEQTGIDSYDIQKFLFLRIMEKIFTEDLENEGIIWDWFFVDFGVEYQVTTDKAEYVLTVDAEDSYTRTF